MDNPCLMCTFRYGQDKYIHWGKNLKLTNKEFENELKLNNLLFEQDTMQIEK